MPHAAARMATRDRDTGRCQRHRPEQTLFYRIVDEYHPAFAAHRIKKAGYPHKTARPGMVTLIQRFGSAPPRRPPPTFSKPPGQYPARSDSEERPAIRRIRDRHGPP